ncbi:hypothetical protein [Exiguobacterium aurantiacum]|uniref:Uncharacterized protein n=1 Tax=Exiguobacterium aurantiacum TaxID=33987 RepID=A0ABY5FPS9_9BACL|nr:hypothetical protein [Exiguobacterium aurantiacum]UTT43433.1 hypothetical protein NMQ00_02725 [Exiguobacterium aurantiacum]
MKNIVFLTGVVLSLLILFGLRYEFHVIGDVGFRIAAILMFVSVLIVRSIAKISFFSHS